MNTHVRRVAGLLAAPALAATAVVAVSAPAAQAVEAPSDPNPARLGASWLAGQLGGGAFTGAFSEGASVDAALALDAVGGQSAAVTGARDALEPKTEGYISWEGTVYPGSAGKLAALVEAADGNTRSFGGFDLIEEIEGRIATSGPAEGRAADSYGTIGQSWAVRALAEAGSDQAEPTTDFLLQQQCSEGFFREIFPDEFAPEGAPLTCDGDPTATASIDATAIAVLNLLGQDDEEHPAVQAALDEAIAWLGSVQLADGSWPGGDFGPNTNTTGLAAWAVGEAGDPATARKAAVWIRGHQADDPASCATALSGQRGAVAYNAAALATARAAGVQPTAVDQFRRATAQALPALQWAPAAKAVPAVAQHIGFVKAGAKQQLSTDGAAPGETVCIAGPGASVLSTADRAGHAAATVTLPKGTADRRYTLSTARGSLGAVTVRVLDAKRLKTVAAKKRVERGAKQRVVVRGLAQGERVVVRVAGKRVGAGNATRKGVFTARFKATGKPGKRAVKVVGKFGDRTGKTTFRVVR